MFALLIFYQQDKGEYGESTDEDLKARLFSRDAAINPTTSPSRAFDCVTYEQHAALHFISAFPESLLALKGSLFFCGSGSCPQKCGTGGLSAFYTPIPCQQWSQSELGTYHSPSENFTGSCPAVLSF